MHMEMKQPQVFILMQSYLVCTVALGHGSQRTLQNDHLWLEIL